MSQSRPAVLALLAIAPLSSPRLSAQNPVITVGPNVQISKDRSKDPHYEYLAGGHLTDPRKMMACSYLYRTDLDPDDSTRSSSSSVVYATADGGKSWKQTLIAEHNGDPVCTYGLGDTAYFVGLKVGGGGGLKMTVYRSADGGMTWSEPVLLPFVDRENLIVDSTGGKYRGRLYINGTGSINSLDSTKYASAVTLFRSLDGGRSFILPPAQRAALDPQGIVGMGNSVVMSDGSIATLFGHMKDAMDMRGPDGAEGRNRSGQPNSWIRVALSNDGGETYGSSAVVADWYMARERSQGSHIPWLAVDPGSGAFKDRLYAVWDDFRDHRLEVLLSYSEDKGKTWSRPVSVTDDRAAPDPIDGPDQITPLVAVNKAGVVGVVWYDRRDQPDNLGWTIRFAASLDGGETFGPSIKVSETANVFGSERWPVTENTKTTSGGRDSLYTWRVGLTGSGFYYSSGHTSGFVADADGVFHPVWGDNRTGVAQMWTAPITVNGVVARFGSPALAGMVNLAGRVALRFGGTVVDRTSNTITFSATLENTSKDTVRGAVKVVVRTLTSPIGTAQLTGSDNGLTGTGAVIDFTSLLRNGALNPGERSQPRTLKIRLSDLKARVRGREGPTSLFELEARVLGEKLGIAAKSPGG